jgi:hypothetical protein
VDMLTADQLTAPRATTDSGFPEDDVEVPGLGMVRVRGLSRKEVIAVRKAADREDTIDGNRALAIERHMLAKAMLAPKMTEAQIGGWQAAGGAAEIEPVVQKVQELSGMDKASPKEAYKSVRGEQRA